MNCFNNYHKKRQEFYDNETQRYIVYNDAYKHLDILLSSDKIHDNKYILTIRDDHTWKHSLKKFNVEELYSFDMEKYKKDIFEIFEKNNCIENLLILNIFENSDDILWKKLSNFLGLACPTKTFPIINLNTV